MRRHSSVGRASGSYPLGHRFESHCRYNSEQLTESCLQGYIITVEQKTALIVIEETEAIRKVAEVLSAALDGYKTIVRPVESFAGTDLLPVNVFFLGCQTPEPPSFSYLNQMLQHINLSGRFCGVFSPDSKALKYLSRLIEASGTTAGKPLLISDASSVSADIQQWIQTIPAD